MDTLTISCMDRRLNSILDKENNGNTVMLRNAGANASALRDSIKDIISGNIGKIKLMAHSDCGAMKVVHSALKEGVKTSDYVYQNLVKQFDGKPFGTRKELEELNEKLQMEELKAISNGIEVESNFVDLSKYHFEEPNALIAVFTYHSTDKYEDLCKRAGLDTEATYFIQASSIEEVYSDIEIAVTKLSIKHIALMAKKPSEYRPVYADMQKLKMKEFMEGTTVQFIKL
ncbi:MAG: hypothetical protein M1360_04210 [Candidatus Marsarchaeota archaeon]|jgi:carbonic anhydrase|nr:hypothetical protein [Candidatus Marsarchaeota archaeon]MCL5419111.1 hypothetical protein [Candidatus Marsarchaeota archaeon]